MSDAPVMHFTNAPLDSAALNILDAVRSFDPGTQPPPWSVGGYIDTNVEAEENPVLPLVTRRGQWVTVSHVQAPHTPVQSLQEEVKGCFGLVRGKYSLLTVTGFLHHSRSAFSGGLRPYSHREYKPLHF